jgi:hypothetical protein
VRITDRQYGPAEVAAKFAHIARREDKSAGYFSLNTSKGEVLTDYAQLEALAESWHSWELASKDRRKGSTSIRFVFSMPLGTDPQKMLEAVRDWAYVEMLDGRWVFAQDQSSDVPIVHFVAARRNIDGTRLHPSKEDLHRYRYTFAETLLRYGISAYEAPSENQLYS